MEAEGARSTVYLTKDNNVYSVAPGDVIDGTYKIVDITADQLEVTYLPLGKKQQIAFASIVQNVQPQANFATAPVARPIDTSRVLSSSMPVPIDAQRAGQGATANARAGAAPGAAPQVSSSAGTATPPPSNTYPASALAPGPGIAPVVVSSPTIFGGSAAPSTSTATGANAPPGGVGAAASAPPMTGGAVPAGAPAGATAGASQPGTGAVPMSAPSVREMPVAPPSAGAMVITPPAASGMPMTRPSGSM
jgi:hypothetical protein